ncbi:MAG: penicillin-binding protein 1A [candidate division FCPU426 bacterium]
MTIPSTHPDPLRPSPFWTLRRAIWLVLWSGMAAVCGIGLAVYLTFLGEIPLVSDLKAYQPSLSTKIYDCKNQLITELFSEQRTLIRLDEVPERLQQAIIAIEDNNFYQHFGIQFSGILRSFMVNFLHKEYKQGGSTITQQLARNMFLTREKTIERKLKEIILALQIERTYQKRDILEMYLNQIYFGNGAHGIESAARTYFGKHAKDLNLPECALLAGLPRSPNTYNPYRNLERSQQRRNLVLSQMERLGFITAQEAAEAKASSIQLTSDQVSEAPYFVEYVRRQLEERYGSTAIYQSGLRVYTSLDLDLQRQAQETMDEGMAEVDKLLAGKIDTLPGQQPEVIQGALVLIDYASGEIRAMIGGRDFAASKFNRAYQAQRQPGSAFKPFIYATAFSHGFTQADVILDTPVVFRDERGAVWKPENFSNTFRGPTTLRSALTHSRNVVTVKLLDKVGVKNVINTARQLGIESPLRPFLTLALGASEVNLLELVSAFGTFPNGGVHVNPVSILRVESNAGEVLEENTPFQTEALPATAAAIMTDLLENVVNRGTGFSARRLGFTLPAGGKTGTTNDYSDAWFLGFTGDYVAGVWVGLDSHRSLGKGVTGGFIACPLWTKLMLRIYANRIPKKFTLPSTVEKVNFCNVSGLLPNPACNQHVVQGVFTIGTAPTQPCDIHTGSDAFGTQASYHLNVSPDLVDFAGNTPVSGSLDDEAPPEHPGPQPEPALPNRPAAPPASDRPPVF